MVSVNSVALAMALAASSALAWSPTNGYAPGNVSCNATTLVRTAGKLNEYEQAFVDDRLSITMPNLVNYLDQLNLTDFDASSFITDDTKIRIAMAFSGGGYRAMLAGAGQFAGFDNRTVNSTKSHHVGGLVQSSTYLAGLSGGNWLVGSIVLNNWTDIQTLQGSSDVWNLEHSILAPGGINIFRDASYWDDIKDDIDDKQDANFNTSITDIWGRGLSNQFINLTNGGPALSFSDIRNYDAFKSREMPYPIHVADGREMGATIISLNSTVFEMTPYELGSWDPNLYSFTDMKYLGTNVSNGRPHTSGQCIAGFDNAGFILGTSSSLFNQFILQLNSTGVSGVVYDLAEHLLTDLGSDNDDIAVYAPNPFAGVEQGGSIADSEWLTLVDGGEDNQNVPLTPLIQPQREVDVIFSFDNSADTDYNWPNGSSLVTTYERQFNSVGNNTIFPYVPDTNTFINSGLTKRPTFFGCNATNLTSLFNSSVPESDRYTPPLVVYIANYAHSFLSNTSTFKLSYSDSETANMIQNGYNIATQNNGTIDSEWAACIGCAIIKRELDRRNQSYTSQCESCYSKYCWDGTINSTTVSENSTNYAPTTDVTSSSKKNSGTSSSAPLSVVAVLFGLVSLVVL